MGLSRNELQFESPGAPVCLTALFLVVLRQQRMKKQHALKNTDHLLRIRSILISCISLMKVIYGARGGGGGYIAGTWRNQVAHYL